MSDTKQQLAVIGQQQETRGLAVEPADGNDTLGHLDQIEHRPAPALVGRRRDVARGLVKDDVASSLPTDKLAIDVDLLLGRIDAHAKLAHDLTVDADTPLFDQSLSLATRRESVRRDDPL